METRTHYKRHKYFSLLVAIATVISLMQGYAGLGSTAWAGPNIWTGGLGPRALSGVAARDMMGNVYAVATGNTQAAYNGHSSTTIYKSPDGGNTWTALGDFGKAPGARYVDDYISLAALADGNTLLLIAGSDEGRSANPSLGRSLLRSTDGGKSWQAILPAFDITHKADLSATTDNIVIDPGSAGRVYLVARSRAVEPHEACFRSTDGGATWGEMPALAGCTSIAVDPGNSAHLLAVANARLQSSEDYGATWRRLAPQQRFPTKELMFAPRPDAQSFVLGTDGNQVYLSKDGGSTWTQVSHAPESVNGQVPGILGIDSVKGQMYYLQETPSSSDASSPIQITHDLYSSTDGEHWTAATGQPLLIVDPPYRRRSISGFVFVDQADPQRVFRVDGMFSSNGGQSWSGPSRDLPLTELPVTNLRVMERSAVPSGWLLMNGKSLYRSTDKGATWAQAYAGGQDPYTNITGAGMNGTNLLVNLFPNFTTHGGSPEYWANTAVLRSTDGGRSWSPPVLNPKGVSVEFTYAGTDGRTVYAAAAPHILSTGGPFAWYGMEGGLYKSSDSGATWITLTMGMVVNNLGIDPQDANHLWAAGDKGLAESRDAGATWSRVRANPQVGGYVSISRGSKGGGTTLYAYQIIPRSEGVASDTGPLYRSTDLGTTWKPVSITGAPARYITRRYSVTGSDRIFVAWSSQQNGPATLSESLDGGVNWRRLNDFGSGGSGGGRVVIDEESGMLLATGSGVDYAPHLLSYQSLSERPDPAFDALWQRQDAPVQKGVVKRSWTWGPQPFSTIREPLVGVPGNSRIVQYYDKSRMEVNDPGADRRSPWFVTNGLLVVEMVAGRIQTGLEKWEPRFPSAVPVAGDANPAVNTQAPTYASFAGLATYENRSHIAPNRVGNTVNESINSGGIVGNQVPPAGQIPPVKLAVYDQAGGHNIAAPFWEFLNRKGQVLENGRYIDKPVLGDWVFVMGRPISEPYWTRPYVSGKAPWVLVQLFERRVLTYTPDNPPVWQVEMGNVGLHYYLWRYSGNP